MADENSMSDDDDQLDIPHNAKHIASIQLGQVDIDCWFHSPYIDNDDDGTDKTRTIDKLFICEYCLRYFINNKKYRQHMNECNQRSPPGRQIYEDPAGLCIYEVDGSTSQLYCQCLCLLAKLFLERKTIYFDVNPFLFYVLVEADKRVKHVHHLIGYFSKEKHSDELYNVACLMVLPHCQRQGFGRFLISLSYELTKLEKKTGSPEKPLSTLGQMTYKNYWRSTILTKLEEFRRSHKSLTVSQLSLETGICLADIVQTLIDLGIAHTDSQQLDRRRPDRNHITPTSVIVINDDLFHSNLIRSSNDSMRADQHLFQPNCLRVTHRR